MNDLTLPALTVSPLPEFPRAGDSSYQRSVPARYTPPAPPEFLRIPAACQYSSLSRSRIYELIQSGELRSSCLRKKGNLRGIRLVHRDSLDRLIREAAEVA